MLFMTTLIMGTVISVSSYSWVGMWAGLEINLLSIIPLMNNSKIRASAESSLKYFITQALASTIILYSIILLSKMSMSFTSMKSLMLLSMNLSFLMKMGAAPLHFWFPEIIEGLDWLSTLILLTWQKIAPMMILMINMSSMKFIIIIIISSMIIGGIQGLNQVSLRKILTFSSINHIGWMMSALMFNISVWFNYFLIYSLLSTILILFFFKLKILYLMQLFSILKTNMLNKLMFNINFLSMGGLPPFLGFFPKWLTINLVVQNKLIFLSVIMVSLTLITLFYYVRITLQSLSTESMQKIKIEKHNMSFSLNFINLLNLFSLILMIQMFNLI
uniref:NADH-ubiquinone oxidoreductase chain 2 n=1 Tax=Gastrallus laevigatus TaxID=1586484 RepID=A0A343C2Y4_9COLE|nr:NADH dehydrogenase subunit 2 [Gastrallus laevigatus]